MLLRWYREWRFKRGVRRFAKAFFKESPLQKRLKEKYAAVPGPPPKRKSVSG